MRAISEAERARTHQAVVTYKLRMAAPYVIFALVGVLLSSLVVVLTVSRSRQHDADFANAPLQAGTAVVGSKVFTREHSGVFVHFQFLFRGRRLSTDDQGGLRTILTDVGDTVSITYRVGKSGAYDLVDWQAPPRKVSLPH